MPLDLSVVLGLRGFGLWLRGKGAYGLGIITHEAKACSSLAHLPRDQQPVVPALEEQLDLRIRFYGPGGCSQVPLGPFEGP